MTLTPHNICDDHLNSTKVKNRNNILTARF